jgi:hypothetical protein
MRRFNTSLILVFVFAFVVFVAYALDGIAQAGIIQGTVKDAVSNLPVSGIYVDAFEVNFGYVSTGCAGPPLTLSNTTNADGQYAFCVLNGIYKVFFRREATISYIGQWWNGASSYSGATPVNVPSGTTVTGIDAKMTYEGVGAIVSGQVTGPNGTALPGVKVSVYDYNQPVESKHGLAAGLSNISGNYVIGTGVGDIFSPLPPGTYKVKCDDHNSGNNNLPKWWNNKDSFLTADPFVITAGGANKADCKLSEGGIITGSVTDVSNSPIKNASIIVYNQNQSVVTFNYTDVTGAYIIRRLPPGNYKVSFKGPYGTNYSPQWYNNQASFNQANWVPVVVGNTTPNINAQLLIGGTITGVTTTGTALAGGKSQPAAGGIRAGSLTAGVSAVVNVYDETRELIASLPSSADGTFSVAGLATGKYKVEFARSNLGSTWFNGHRTFDSADWVLVNAGSTTPDVNGQLVPAAVISGKVTDTLGAAIPKVIVRAYDDVTLESLNPTAMTDSFGAYTLSSLSPGGSRLYFDSFGTGYFSEWWDDEKSASAATPIVLVSGTTYSNKDAQLDLSSNVYLPLLLKN